MEARVVLFVPSRGRGCDRGTPILPPFGTGTPSCDCWSSSESKELMMLSSWLKEPDTEDPRDTEDPFCLFTFQRPSEVPFLLTLKTTNHLHPHTTRFCSDPHPSEHRRNSTRRRWVLETAPEGKVLGRARERLEGTRRGRV